MVATSAVARRTGNVSAGITIFAMIVLEKPLAGVYEEIDMVTTPAGKPVAMVHCNNCTSDFDAWVRLFGQVWYTCPISIPEIRLEMLFLLISRDFITLFAHIPLSAGLRQMNLLWTAFLPPSRNHQ